MTVWGPGVPKYGLRRNASERFWGKVAKAGPNECWIWQAANNDNRRANLRAVSRQQNAQNFPAQRGARSRFRGVGWSEGRQKWIAHARVDGRNIYLGIFADEQEAAKVASEFRRNHLTHTVEDAA